MPDVYLTRAGFQKLSNELDRLKNAERHKISKAIGEARLLGDLKENAEYHAAKEEQAVCEARIAELESNLSGVKIIEDLNIPADKIYIGAIVTLKDLHTQREVVYQLLSPEEADFEANKLSIFSPIGKGLMGHRVDEELKVETPSGVVKYRVLKIARP
jgi:transcription elongation factor GreA